MHVVLNAAAKRGPAGSLESLPASCRNHRAHDAHRANALGWDGSASSKCGQHVLTPQAGFACVPGHGTNLMHHLQISKSYLYPFTGCLLLRVCQAKTLVAPRVRVRLRRPQPGRERRHVKAAACPRWADPVPGLAVVGIALGRVPRVQDRRCDVATAARERHQRPLDVTRAQPSRQVIERARRAGGPAELGRVKRHGGKT